MKWTNTKVSDKLLVPLGDIETLAEGEKRLVTAGPFEVLVCRVKGELFAIENKCSHQERPLDRGRLRNHLLVCPVHGATFDVRDGTHKSPPATCGIASFPVIQCEQGACVEVPRERKKAPVDPFSGPQMVRTR